MSHYVTKALQNNYYLALRSPQYAPHQWTKPAYGQKIQYTIPPSSLPILDKKGTRRIQSINSNFLYYARAITPTILPAINENFFSASSTYIWYHRQIQCVNGLCAHTPQRHHPLPCKKYVLTHWFWRRLPCPTKGKKPMSSSLSPRQHYIIINYNIFTQKSTVLF